MATITSAASGNFSAGATWVGGVVPTVGDTAVAATGHVVAIDVDVTVDKVSQAGTGKFTLGNGRTLTAEVEAVAGTFTSGGTVEVTATAGNTAYIVGNVTGVSSTAVNVCGVNVTGLGTLELTGDVTGSAGNVSSEANGHAAVFTDVECEIVIQGNVSSGVGSHKRGVQAGANSGAVNITITGNVSGSNGGSAYGVFLSAGSANVTITGNVNAGAGSNSHGVNATGANAAITIVGDVTGLLGSGVRATGSTATVTITGDVSGGTLAFGFGVSATGAFAGVMTTGNVSGGTGSTAYGVYTTGNASLADITGTIAATNPSAHGVVNEAATSGIGVSATGYGVILNGNMVDHPIGVTATWTRFLRVNSTANTLNQYADSINWPNNPPVNRIRPEDVTGMAQQADVRAGTVFGFNDELTGTLVVPPLEPVSFGVPVDGATGTAALKLGDVAAVTGAQIAAALG
jgi:hypothetical protein